MTTPTGGRRSDRRPGEGRYAHPEREQRWLVRSLPPTARPVAEIVDHYIAATRLRLRRMDHEDGLLLKLAQKVRPDPTSPELVHLTNIYLSPAEYDVLAKLEGADLHKTRHRLAGAVAGVIAVDQFHGRLSGLLLAEVELEPDAPRLETPDFAERDVTDDDRFSGGWLAMASDDQVIELFAEIGIAQPG